MIITDPEHWRLRLKWQEYYGIIAQQSAAGLFWFVTSSCFRLIAYIIDCNHIIQPNDLNSLIIQSLPGEIQCIITHSSEHY